MKPNGKIAPYSIKLTDVTVSYSNLPILKDISWMVPRGTITAVIGPNGGGKTTLLRTLVGILEPIKGTVHVLGMEPVQARPFIAYLPQNDEIDWQFPIRVLDVVVQGRLNHKPWWCRLRKPDYDAAFSALEQINLASYAFRPINELSGGQRQRVLLARSLCQKAQIILLDEPTTGLDSSAQKDLIDTLQLLKNQQCTIIMTTHDFHTVDNCFDTVLCLRGDILYNGPPEKVMTPTTMLAVFGSTPVKDQVNSFEYRN